MTTRHILPVLLVGALTTMAGCTSQQVYESGTAFRFQECERIVDAGKRAECMTLARMSYKEYQELNKDRAR